MAYKGVKQLKISDSDSDDISRSGSEGILKDSQDIEANEVMLPTENDPEFEIICPDFNDVQPYHQDNQRNIDELIFEKSRVRIPNY